MREVTERDLRMPELRDAKPEELEFRDDGRLVRKDRWERGFLDIACIIGWARKDYEIPEVVEEVRRRLGCGEDSEYEWTKPSDPELFRFINATPLVSSLLYDLNLLPESIHDPIRWVYMLEVCEHMKAALAFGVLEIAQPTRPTDAALEQCRLLDELIASWRDTGDSPEKAERRIRARAAVEAAWPAAPPAEPEGFISEADLRKMRGGRAVIIYPATITTGDVPLYVHGVREGGNG